MAVEAARTAVLLAFGLLVLADWGVLGGLLLAAFLIGLGETVVDSSVHAVLPRLVAEPSLARANGVLFSTETATEELLGPAFGGVLFGLAAALPFLIDGVSFAVAAVLVGLAFRGVADTGRTGVAVPLRRDMADGFGFFVRTRVLRLMAGLVGCFAFCQALVFGPLVLFALDGLGLSDAGYGLLLAATAVGNVAGGVWAGRLDRRFGPQILLPAAGLVAAAGYAVCGRAESWLVAALALAVEAVAVAVGNVASLALRQRVIPNELLGRVGNIFRFFIFGAIPLGALAGGFLVQGIGLRAPFAVAAGLQVVVVALLAPPLARELRRRGLERGEEHSYGAGC
jgi:predicted MFS family arabinose efflux permease